MKQAQHPDVGCIEWDMIRWEDIDCPLCDQRDEEVLVTKNAPENKAVYRVVRCRQCGMGYLNPRPDERCIGQFYQDGYHCYQASHSRPKRWLTRLRDRFYPRILSQYFGYPPELTNRKDRIVAWLAAWFCYPHWQSMTRLPFQGEGKLLDYGCGSGALAQRLTDLGWDVSAMDFSAHATEQVRKNFGIPTFTGSLPHPDLANESFDAITMGAVLEHVHWPHKLIDAASQLLNPNGIMLISVPNINSWSFQHFREHWYGLHLPHHTLHFSRDTLQLLLEMHGFDVMEMRKVNKPGWVRHSLSQAGSKWSNSRFAARWLTRYAQWKGEPDCLTALVRKRREEQPRRRQAVDFVDKRSTREQIAQAVDATV